ncbi:hypothetical protein GUJ93_ZPchr0001g30734 [Zizania palustris]|uniref:Uncharacterized protein n=1 Tax=Zizania palustris TaxID=103762 RepID=A0A8J5V601_ZIZPA|nr:hypothetical protein GUJ93_ZPchr0001g30734 [Zizania palustris]
MNSEDDFEKNVELGQWVNSSVMPAEEHDDAAADDVEPRPLLPRHLAHSSSPSFFSYPLLLLHRELELHLSLALIDRRFKLMEDTEMVMKTQRESKVIKASAG